jgi:hypothetical protein
LRLLGLLPRTQADALVGVARDGDLGCSRTFTFDLNRFEPPADAEVS